MKYKSIGLGCLLLAAALVYVVYNNHFRALQTPEYAKTPDNQQLRSNTNELMDSSVQDTASPTVLNVKEFASPALKEQIGWVAASFEEQAQYPHYSVPILDPDLAKTPLPFQQARVEMKVFDSNGDLSELGIAASVGKMQYAVGEPIEIQAQLSGIETGVAVFVEAEIKASDSTKSLSDTVDLSPYNTSQSEFRATIDSASLQLDGDSQELLAVVTVQINGTEHINTVPFILSNTSALLTGIGDTEQRDDFLLITLNYDVDQAGYYFVSAYLDDARSGRPLLALQGEGRMSSGRSNLTLKAHQRALKDAGSEGPYHLRIAKSFRGAEPGEGEDVHTAVSQAYYSIPEFAFDGYADTPYSDPAVEARLQALKSLTGNE